MKFVRFSLGGKVTSGRLIDGEVFPDATTDFERSYPLEKARLLSPVMPSKVVAVGLNYRDHAEELDMALPDEPLLFLKPPSSVIGPDAEIILPPESKRIDYEAELAIVIGKPASRVPVGEAAEHIFGYTCLNDVTARDLQQKDGQWTRAKGFDTFCPLGPWIETELDTADLSIELYLNGKRKQASRTSELIFGPNELVAFISHIMTLQAGDVIATGTTSGIGPMTAGDEVEVRIEGIGSLRNRAVEGTQ